MKKIRLGHIFGDFVESDYGRSRSTVASLPSLGVGVNRWIWGVTICVLLLLLARMLVLQIFYGERYRLLSDQNRIKQIRLAAPRGKIFDRNGRELARNLTIDADTWAREYPLGESATHVIGFLGEVGEGEVGLVVDPGETYELGSLVGRSGIESEYEERLRGRDGGRLVEVDNAGKPVRELGKREPLPGADLTLTLDASLQQVAHLAVLEKKAAVVASNPQTGEVLVLASAPNQEFNRAMGGAYPPGSVFKMVTVLAALQEDKLRSDFTYTDTGSIVVNNFSYTNWYFTQYGRTEGIVDWTRALARSVDTFFYKVGEYTGPEIMAKWARYLGYGEKTGIDIPGEVDGLIPTPTWKQQVKNEPWFLGNTYHMAIGQGDVLATPLQVNLMTNILAASGKKCQLHLNKVLSTKCEVLSIKPETLELVKQGMVEACSEGGTAFPLFELNTEGKPGVACKTGTAEYVRPDGKMGTHAWLTAYAPIANPTISVTVLVEAGGEGSKAAAPVARQILVKYFNLEDKFNYAAISGEGE